MAHRKSRQAGKSSTVEVTREMLDAAMAKLQEYDRAWEYVDRDMMLDILRAAISRKMDMPKTLEELDRELRPDRAGLAALREAVGDEIKRKQVIVEKLRELSRTVVQQEFCTSNQLAAAIDLVCKLAAGSDAGAKQ